MNKQSVIKKTVSFVKDRLSHDTSGHDWWHIQRDWNNAKAINKKERADQFIVDLAVLLHDVGDRKIIGTKEDDYTIARKFLESCKVDKKVIDQVVFIIEYMSFSNSFGKNINKSKELQIVQDADRLDAIGAIGIARLFAYGGNKGRLLYDPTMRIQKVRSRDQYRKLNTTSFHHFHEKLLLLKDLMNTKTAKAIATQRHKYMQDYMKRFLLEWDGNK